MGNVSPVGSASVHNIGSGTNEPKKLGFFARVAQFLSRFVCGATPTSPQLPLQPSCTYCSSIELNELICSLEEGVSADEIRNQVKNKWILPGSLDDVIGVAIGGQVQPRRSVLEQAGKRGELDILNALMGAVENRVHERVNYKTKAVDCAVLGLLQDNNAATLYKFCRKNSGIIHPAFFLAMVVARQPKNTDVFEAFLNEHGQHIAPDFHEKFPNAKKLLDPEQESASSNESQVESEAKLGSYQGLIDTKRSAAFAFEYFKAADKLTGISIFDAANSFGDERLKELFFGLISDRSEGNLSEATSRLFPAEKPKQSPQAEQQTLEPPQEVTSNPKSPAHRKKVNQEEPNESKKTVRFADKLPTPKPLTQHLPPQLHNRLTQHHQVRVLGARVFCAA